MKYKGWTIKKESYTEDNILRKVFTVFSISLPNWPLFSGRKKDCIEFINNRERLFAE